MKKLMLAAIASIMCVGAMAQDNMNSGSMTMMGGPWGMRKSTGDAVMDRLWFISDRTLNSAEADTLMSMLRHMGGAQAYTLQKAIVNAIDNMAKDNPGWSDRNSWSNMGSMKMMGDVETYMMLEKGLTYQEAGVLHNWASMSTSEQQDVVLKLVRHAGWANWSWMNMNHG